MEAAKKIDTSECSIQMVHNTLDRLNTPTGHLINRLGQLLSRDKTVRSVMAELMECRSQAVEQLHKVVHTKLPIPAELGEEAAEAVKPWQITIQAELERVIAMMSLNAPDYLQVDVIQDLVKATQELLYVNGDALIELGPHFIKGDPLRQKILDSVANVDQALATLRERSGILGVHS